MAKNEQDKLANVEQDKGDSGEQYDIANIDLPQANANGWQKWLFGMGMLASLILFGTFMWITVQQNNILQDSISKAPILEDSVLYKTTTLQLPSGFSQEEREHIQMMLLENEIIKKKYHSANILMRTHIFIKYLGFLTGMILSVLGALFILGKFREYPTKITVKGEKIPTGSLKTTSPGIILSVIGAIIMIITILDNKKIEVQDGAVYIHSEAEDSMRNDSAKSANKPPVKPKK